MPWVSPVAGGVEPVAGAVLAPVGRGEEPVDEPLVGAFLRVVEEGGERARIGRQAGQVEGHAPGERAPVGFCGGAEPRVLEPCQDEAVERVAAPGFVFDRGRRRPVDGGERPVLVPGGALLDPAGEDFDLFRGERLVRDLGRHPPERVGVRDALDQETRRGVAGNDRWIARPVAAPGGRPRAERAVPGVEPQVGLARRLVGPVAGEAVVGEDRPDVALEVDRGRRLGGRGGQGWRRSGNRQEHARQSN